MNTLKDSIVGRKVKGKRETKIRLSNIHMQSTKHLIIKLSILLGVITFMLDKIHD